MLKITFLNVGQGDSIIFEWNDNEENKIGIIDSNVFNSSNPSLEYLKLKNTNTIDFVILSHPHTDHFSGLKEILEHCEKNDIKIKNFLFTSFQTIHYIKSAVNDTGSKSELKQLLKKVNELYDNKLIENITFVILGKNDIRLTDDILIKIISPSEYEYTKYTQQTGIFTVNDDEDPTNNPNANLLSTVLKVYSLRFHWYVILTSDVMKKTLENLWIKHQNLILGNLYLGQCPHHGSKNNLENMFWKTRTRISQTPIVFSVGVNSFGHPSQHVVDFYRKNDFKIYSTNQIGILNKTTYLPIPSVSKKLNTFSKLISQPKSYKYDTDLDGNKEFIINENDIYFNGSKLTI